MNMINKHLRLLIGWFAVLGLFVTACHDNFPLRQFDGDEEVMQIYDYVKSRSDLSIYKAIADYSGFYSQISTWGTYTCFVPNDSAFLSLYTELGISDYKEKEPQYWKYYMLYHTVEKEKMNTNALEGGNMKQPTMMGTGEEYYLVVDASDYMAIKLNNRATIVEQNIDLRNGYVNIINQVLEPPIQNVYEMLKESGEFSRMLKLFEDNGLKGYLTDSTVTVLVEPDRVLEDVFEPEALEDVKAWLQYHIIPGERSYVQQLSGRTVQTLYPDEPTTFNYADNRLWANQKDYFGVSDKTAINGIYHTMAVPLQIREHTAGKVRMNLYGRDNAKKGYQQNVFAELPALIQENPGYNSFHQGTIKKAKPPICQFMGTQVGDVFYLTIPDVVPGNYTVRLIYYVNYSCDLTLIFKEQIVSTNVVLSTKDGDFEELTSLNYKNLGSIELKSREDVTLRFMSTKGTTMLMDMIELIPIVDFVPEY